MADLLERLKTALADRYAIERELGRGGMATVYLAEDLKHQRKVAIKVLHPELAATLGPDRFLREIKIAAQLSHPHILPLLDSGEASGFLYYVMPYVEGESLRGRLIRAGALPLGDAMRILREVADALSYAHGRGLVHRDVKPENIMLSGRHALVTDFGVAKAVSEATGRQALTTAGVALGTPAYMAPEQAAADPHTDHRADIYAFGIVAYELLAGEPPFGGSVQAILAAHLSKPPVPVNECREVPAAFAELIMRCLKKKPADRWQSAEDILPLLESLSTTPTAGTTPTNTAPIRIRHTSRLGRSLTGGALVLIVAAVLGWVLWGRPADAIHLGPIQVFTSDPGIEIDPVLSPDGKFVAYAAGPRLSETKIFVKQTTGGSTIAVTGNQRGTHRLPQWSPDGTKLLYLSAESDHTSLEVIPAFSGTPKTVVRAGPLPFRLEDNGTLRGGTWSPRGDEVAYVLGDTIHLYRLESGSDSSLAVVPRASHSLSWSPNGRAIAFVAGNAGWVLNASPNRARTSIWILRVSSGQTIPISGDAALNVGPVWMEDGKGLLFISNREGRRDLYQVRLRSSGHPVGEPSRVTSGLDLYSVSISRDHRLVYASLRDDANIFSIPISRGAAVPASRAHAITGGSQTIEGVSLSPDSKWLVFDYEERGENSGHYKISTTGGEPQQLSGDPNPSNPGSWTADGKEVAAMLVRNGSADVYLLSADGSGMRRVTGDSAGELYPSLSPTTNEMIYVQAARGGNETRITALTSGVLAKPGRLLTSNNSTGAAGAPKWSPKGDVIAYASEGVLKVMSPDGSGLRVLVQTSVQGVAWDHSGRTIIFRRIDPDRRWSFWTLPKVGGEPRMVVFQDDVSLQSTQRFDADDENIYFTMSQVRSDILMSEILK